MAVAYTAIYLGLIYWNEYFRPYTISATKHDHISHNVYHIGHTLCGHTVYTGPTVQIPAKCTVS